MKKIFQLIISLLCSLFMIVTYNNNLSCAEASDFSYEIINGEIKITGYHGISGDIIISNEINGYQVTSIGYRAFLYTGAMLESIKLPEGLRTIEDEAFIYVAGYGVKNLILPKSIETIGNKAFGYSFIKAVDDYNYCIKLENTIIQGYKGTAAETYAKENGFTFVALDDNPEVTTATTMTTQTTTTSTTVSTTATSKATTETTKATTSTTITTTTSATTVTTNSTTTISTSASTTASSTSISTTTSATSTSKDTTTNLTTPLTTTSTSETTPITTTHVKGDANGDNKLDVRDAAFIAQKIALDKASELPKCADFNEDGTVNVRDAAAIARYLASRKR